MVHEKLVNFMAPIENNKELENTNLIKMTLFGIINNEINNENKNNIDIENDVDLI